MTSTPVRKARFSRRTDWNRSSSELQSSSFSASTDRPLLDLTVSNPTTCGLAMSEGDLLAPLHNVAALRYKPEPRGLLSARESIVEYYAGHGATVSPEQLILTASTSEAYSHLFRLLCEAGDEVLVAQPGYPLCNYLADLSDVSLRFYPLFYDHGWWIDTTRLEGAITPRTRALLVVHPNNPTGHPTSAEERDYLLALCRRYELALIVDEVFLDFPHEQLTKVRSFATSISPPLTFVLSGLSKIAALPQMKVGWILALGPDAEQSEALARLEIVADTFLSVSTPSQLALPAWLKKAPAVQREILRRISANRDSLHAAKLQSYEVSAGWSAILRLPPIFAEETAFETLEHQGILTHPAHFYGLEDPHRVIISLISPVEIMFQAMQRIGQLLARSSS